MATTRHDRSTQWATYEANVQAYRGLSMSTQSVFLAVGAILLDVGFKVPFFVMFGLAMIATWYVFFPAIAARTRIVDFHKFELDRLLLRDGTLAGDDASEETDRLREREYAHGTNRELRARVAQTLRDAGFPRPTQWGPTRFKLDVVLPLLTTAAWIVFGVYVAVFR